MRATTDTTPRAWVGCLACYNAGRLVGLWVDGIDAEDLTTEDVHTRSEIAEPPDAEWFHHEELWVMDHSGYAGLLSGECSPSKATELADQLRDLERDGIEVEAFTAYADYVGGVDYARESFEEAYAGQWDSFEAYAEEWVRDVGMLRDVPDNVARYFDHRRFADDLRYDFHVVDVPNARGVYIFRCV